MAKQLQNNCETNQKFIINDHIDDNNGVNEIEIHEDDSSEGSFENDIMYEDNVDNNEDEMTEEESEYPDEITVTTQNCEQFGAGKKIVTEDGLNLKTSGIRNTKVRKILDIEHSSRDNLKRKNSGNFL